MYFIDQINNYQPVNQQEKIDKSVMLAMIAKFPENILTRANTIAHMTSSGFIINQSLTKTLMIHHNIYHSWGWTGGHADNDFDLAHVACKEATEETGVTVALAKQEIAALDILPVFSHIKNGNFINTHLHFNVCYLLFADENELPRSKPDENSGAKWLPLTKINDYVSEGHMLPVYKKLIEKVKKLYEQ